MELLLQQVMAGLANGAIYACMALAVVMIFQAIDHLNFAQGEMAMFSTFIAWQLIHWGMPYWVAFVTWSSCRSSAGSRSSGCCSGRCTTHRSSPSSSRSSPCSASSTAPPAISGITRSRTFRRRSAQAACSARLIDAHEAGMIGVTAVMLGLLYLFFRGTRLGLAMRAAAANPESARLVGIRVGWMTALGWGMAAAIGAVAGMLIAPVVFLEPNMMLGVLLYGFAGAVLGGLTSPGGAVLGGFAVGIIENLAGTFIPYFGRELKLTIALIVIVVVLMVRPGGIFGRSVVSRV